VNLVKLLRGDGGGVHVDDVERGRQTRLTLGLSLGHLEVEDGGSTGGPSRAENALFLTVHLAKVGSGGVGGEEENRFLEGYDEGSAYMLLSMAMGFRAQYFPGTRAMGDFSP
jgi:hypothetical protein